jgi:hypothetical protein
VCRRRYEALSHANVIFLLRGSRKKREDEDEDEDEYKDKDKDESGGRTAGDLECAVQPHCGVGIDDEPLSVGCICHRDGYRQTGPWGVNNMSADRNSIL